MIQSERWHQIEQICEGALKRPVSERAAFLKEACGEDEAMRQEVETLLAHEESAKAFLEEPALEAAAKVLVERQGESRVGQQLGGYTILSLLGAGGMGEVYLARDTLLDRKVAIKFLPPESTANEQAKRRLIREAKAAAKLDHSNICSIYDIAEENGANFIVMQYVEGENLASRIKQRSLGLKEALDIGVQVAEALTEAHSKGIIHRDIKPQNIMLTARGQVKMLDFGLAKVVPNRALASEAETQTLLTEAGAILGTVPYMSPEQVKGESLDARSDQFSFGAVLYEMISGHQPFAARTMAETISAILVNEPPPLASYSIRAPAGFERILRKCLEKDRERRFQSMAEVSADLKAVRRQCDSGQVTSASSDATTARMEAVTRGQRVEWRRLLSRRSAVALIAVVILAVATGYALLFRRPVAPPAAGSKSVNVNSPAYDHYLRGKVNVGSQNRESNENAVKLLQQAVAADPNFAPAYAELAIAYILKSFFIASGAERKKLNEDAEVAVAKALILNPDLPEGHFARGQLLWTPDRRFLHEPAIHSYKRALALDPNLDEAHHQLGMIYGHIGLLDKGWDEIAKAVAINPANRLARFRLGTIALYQGKHDEALTIFKTIPPDASPVLLHRTTATALFQLGRTQEASKVVEEYLRAYPMDEGGNVTSVKAMLFAKAGKKPEAEETIQRAIKIGEGFGHFHHTAYNIASAYALLNKPEQAVKWLQATADDGFPCYALFENDANLNSLRKDERFIAFMTELKQRWQRYQATL